MRKNLLIINAAELVTCSGNRAKKGKEMNCLKIIEDGAIAVDDGIIKYIGTTKEVIKKVDIDLYKVIDASGKTVTPGFVDSHTHFIFGGYRADEFSWRLKGMSYMDIMERGGGINRSLVGTREATLEELVALGKKRLDSMLRFGVTTVEGKSGYGMDYDTEIKQLKAMKLVNDEHPVDVVSTFLGAHSVPPEYKGKADEFIDFIIEEVLDDVVDNDLADFCDIFCEKNVFSIEQSRKLLSIAKSKGMALKLHADEIVQLGGTELAVELGATSADHLLQASDQGIKKLSDSNTIATLLPCTAFSLKEDYAKARQMIDEGCAVALATDFNPGSCFTESIPLLISLATLYMQMTIEESITALTINGAAAINKADKIGSLDVGKQGDILIHEFPTHEFLSYHIGVSTVETVIKKGEIVYKR